MEMKLDGKVEVRWIGDPVTEAAAVEALGWPSMMEAEAGVCERWIRVPMSRRADVMAAIAAEGGQVLIGKSLGAGGQDRRRPHAQS